MLLILYFIFYSGRRGNGETRGTEEAFLFSQDTSLHHTYLCTDPHTAGESEGAWQGVGRLFHFKLLWQQFQAMLEDVPQGTRYHIPFASPF